MIGIVQSYVLFLKRDMFVVCPLSFWCVVVQSHPFMRDEKMVSQLSVRTSTMFSSSSSSFLCSKIKKETKALFIIHYSFHHLYIIIEVISNYNSQHS